MAGGNNRRQKQKEVEEGLSQDKLSKYLLYFKQALALTLGIFLGASGVTGYVGFLIYIICHYFLTLVILKKSFNVEDEGEHGSLLELILDGIPNSLGMFMLSWITTYNLVVV